MSILSHLFRILKTKTIKKKKLSLYMSTLSFSGEASMHSQNALSQRKVMLIQNQ